MAGSETGVRCQDGFCLPRKEDRGLCRRVFLARLPEVLPVPENEQGLLVSQGRWQQEKGSSPGESPPEERMAGMEVLGMQGQARRAPLCRNHREEAGQMIGADDSKQVSGGGAAVSCLAWQMSVSLHEASTE